MGVVVGVAVVVEVDGEDEAALAEAALEEEVEVGVVEASRVPGAADEGEGEGG